MYLEQAEANGIDPFQARRILHWYTSIAWRRYRQGVTGIVDPIVAIHDQYERELRGSPIVTPPPPHVGLA